MVPKHNQERKLVCQPIIWVTFRRLFAISITGCVLLKGGHTRYMQTNNNVIRKIISNDKVVDIPRRRAHYWPHYIRQDKRLSFLGRIFSLKNLLVGGGSWPTTQSRKCFLISGWLCEWQTTETMACSLQGSKFLTLLHPWSKLPIKLPSVCLYIEIMYVMFLSIHV